MLELVQETLKISKQQIELESRESSRYRGGNALIPLQTIERVVSEPLYRALASSLSEADHFTVSVFLLSIAYFLANSLTDAYQILIISPPQG